jgi:uncharacterized membrane protein HdeD (DUF308 family)
MHDTLVNRWRVLVLRGVIAIAFGILTFVSPGSSLFAIVILFGAYALVDGIFSVVGFFKAPHGHRRWTSFVFEGIAGIAAGLLAFFWPGMTALALVFLFAAWALLHGVAEVVAAVRLRKHMKGEWLLALSGLLSVALGVLLMLFPGPGAVVLILWVGAYAFVSGILFLVLGLRLRQRERAEEPLPPSLQHPRPA